MSVFYKVYKRSKVFTLVQKIYQKNDSQEKASTAYKFDYKTNLFIKMIVIFL